jgi:hypothetical protein
MDYVYNAWLGEKMKKDYQTKDIKATTNKSVEITEGDDGLFYFEWKELGKQGFSTLENAEIALNRLKKGE